MYFWKIEDLKKDLTSLKEGILQKEEIKYFFLYVLFESLSYLSFYSYDFSNEYDLYLDFIIAVLNLLGVYYIYKCNDGANGKNFLQRYFSLGFCFSYSSCCVFSYPIFYIRVGSFFYWLKFREYV